MRAATVATVLMPDERARVEAAGQDCFVALHGDSLDDAIRQVRRRTVDAVFLSVHQCDDAQIPRVAQFVREFPQVPAVALISRLDREAPRRVLGLGASGVRAVVDVSVPAGWDQLRELLREPSSPVAARVMGALAPDLGGVPTDCRLFFEVVVRRAPELRTVRRLARALKVVPSTLMSRFYRTNLPSPKTYLAHARLLHAAWLCRNTGLSIADVSNRLEYSSPRASDATCGRCWISPRESSGGACRSKRRWFASARASSPRTGTGCSGSIHWERCPGNTDRPRREPPARAG